MAESLEEPFRLAQRAMADLKAAVYVVIQHGPPIGMRNADISRALGLHAGHARHEGHITRTVLSLMEVDGVLTQDSETKLWTIRRIDESPSDDASNAESAHDSP